MVCVYCGGSTRVVNSRHQQKNNQVWRRRHCEACGAVFSTEEAPRLGLAWRVWTGTRLRAFSRAKLFMSLPNSCGHRKTALDDAEGLTETVIAKLKPLVKDGVVNNRDIVRVAQVALNRFDKAASIYYEARQKG